MKIVQLVQLSMSHAGGFARGAEAARLLTEAARERGGQLKSGVWDVCDRGDRALLADHRARRGDAERAAHRVPHWPQTHEHSSPAGPAAWHIGELVQ